MNDEREQARGIVRSGPVWRAVQIVGSFVALGFAALTATGWLSYLGELIRIRETGGLDTHLPSSGYVVFGFVLWFVPLVIVMATMLIAFGWRNLATKIIILVACVLTVGTIIATVVVA